MTLNRIRSAGFWIIGGKSTVSNHISRCVCCRKLRGSVQEQRVANLPEDRVQPAPPFSYCAVDYFGPWYVKEGRRQLKRYGVLFTCMASRAVHLEVANSLSADSLINAYRRFDGRRGTVRHLRSDQGTYFEGREERPSKVTRRARAKQTEARTSEEKLQLGDLQDECAPCKPHVRRVGTPDSNGAECTGGPSPSPWIAA